MPCQQRPSHPSSMRHYEIAGKVALWTYPVFALLQRRCPNAILLWLVAPPRTESAEEMFGEIVQGHRRMTRDE